MKKGFLKSKIFLLVFTMGFLPEALAQSQCKDSFSFIYNKEVEAQLIKDSFSFFYTKEVKAQLISDIKASQKKHSADETHERDFKNLIHDVETSNLIGIKENLTKYPAWAEEFPNLKIIPFLDYEMTKIEIPVLLPISYKLKFEF